MKTINKLKMTILVVLSVMNLTWLQAQAPSQSDAVMLQGFYWDSQSETSWTKLTTMASEIATNFDMVWLPPSSLSEGGVGYHPRQWNNQNSTWGSATELKTLISTLKAGGCRAIADIVVNHRGGKTTWNDFYEDDFGSYGKFQLTSAHICKDDECVGSGYAATGANDTGYNVECGARGGYCAARDLDHANPYVQNDIKAYLKWLKGEFGYDGWRYDLTKGYNGRYNDLYNSAAGAYYSVGEYWARDFNACWNWVKDANYNSTAFDFPMKYEALNDGLAAGNYGKMIWSGGPAGLIHKPQYSRYSTTFVDNHDTYRDGSKYTGDVQKAYAFILSSPGIPCVFWPHWTTNKSAINNMIKVRKACGIHNESVCSANANNGYYSETQGTRAKLICKIGSTGTPSGYKVAASGTGWAFYVPSDFDVDANVPPKTAVSLTMNPEAGVYSGGTTVTLSATGNNTPISIYYTTNGTTPTSSSTKYTSPLSISSTTTVKAIAIDNNGNQTSVISKTYRTESSTITLKFKAPSSWTQCNLWAWDPASGAKIAGGSSWPGNATMTLGSDGYYSYTISNLTATTIGLLFNNGASTGTLQTVDLTTSSNACWDALTTTDTEGKYNVSLNTACTPTAIAENTASTVRCYPNPASTEMYIASEDAIKNVSIQDINGKQIWSDKSSVVDVSHFPSGLYVIQVDTENGDRFIEKMIKK